MLIKLLVLITNLLNQLYRGEKAAYEFIKVILEEHKYCKKIMKKHFNKNLIMTEDEEDLLKKKVIIVGFVKNLLIMMKTKLEIIVT